MARVTGGCCPAGASVPCGHGAAGDYDGSYTRNDHWSECRVRAPGSTTRLPPSITDPTERSNSVYRRTSTSSANSTHRVTVTPPDMETYRDRDGADAWCGTVAHCARISSVRVMLSLSLGVRYLSKLGHDVVGVRPDIFDVGDDYLPSCIETARRVVADPGRIGGVIGGSGNGEKISANKVAGCRAVLAWSTETDRLTRERNDVQVVGVGARMHGSAGAAGIVEAFFATPFFDGEWHGCRIWMISDFGAAGDVPPICAG